ncbi:hypothetical protein [Teichococcus oryzae]|uniref:Uncharacterized protein n=1 Tax=Teichococcus oryzae TaxID=1608942 RepID=A0A5B2TIQ2_9PROT|nr:hypothetical protein [Pseudoroseomonas oryzae]KAA2213993.1 hypothetical protein F0Q34_08100 [Pseudoroseomonas oryzae]
MIPEFPVSRVLFMIVYGLLALIGLYCAGRGQDFGLSLFGTLLGLFGLAMAFLLIKRGWDQARPE